MLAPEEITDTPSTVITENEPISISKKSDEQSSLSKKEEKESFKKFKKLIFKHPLLPVLLLQLNLCEQAMLSVDDPTPISMKPMEELIQQMQKDGVQMKTGNKELDTFMIDYIFQLRKSMVELHKVAGYCEEFKTRYLKNFVKFFGSNLAFDGILEDDEEEKSDISENYLTLLTQECSDLDEENRNKLILKIINGETDILKSISSKCQLKKDT